MKTLLRLRTLVILASLVLAVGAVLAARAVAQGDLNQQPAKVGEGGTVSATDLAKPAKDFYAVVDADGTLVRGRGAVSVTRFSGGTGIGQYWVTFDRKVTKCAYVGSIGDPGSGDSAQPGEITVGGVPDNEKQVFVATYSSLGASANLEDHGFHLQVSC
jgi:hypothetical protein